MGMIRELIGGQLERIGQMWLQPESPPDPADGGLGQAGAFRHGSPRPVRRVIRRFLQCIDNDFFYLLVGDRRLLPRARLIGEPVQALADKSPTPFPYRILMASEDSSGLLIVIAFCACKDDFCPQRQDL